VALQKVKCIRCIDFASRTSPAAEASACSLPPACPAPGDAHERVAGRPTASRASIRRVGQLREAWLMDRLSGPSFGGALHVIFLAAFFSSDSFP